MKQNIVLEREGGRSRYTRKGEPAGDREGEAGLQASLVAKDMGSGPEPPSRWSSLSGSFCRRAAGVSSAAPGSWMQVAK